MRVHLPEHPAGLVSTSTLRNKISTFVIKFNSKKKPFVQQGKFKEESRADQRSEFEIVDFTLPLYFLETSLLFKSKCDLVRGSEIHSTRGRENYLALRHITVVHELGQFVNQLPNSIINNQRQRSSKFA